MPEGRPQVELRQDTRSNEWYAVRGEKVLGRHHNIDELASAIRTAGLGVPARLRPHDVRNTYQFWLAATMKADMLRVEIIKTVGRADLSVASPDVQKNIKAAKAMFAEHGTRREKHQDKQLIADVRRNLARQGLSPDAIAQRVEPLEAAFRAGWNDMPTINPPPPPPPPPSSPDAQASAVEIAQRNFPGSQASIQAVPQPKGTKKTPSASQQKAAVAKKGRGRRPGRPPGRR
jgi:hypothetical protein